MQILTILNLMKDTTHFHSCVSTEAATHSTPQHTCAHTVAAGSLPCARSMRINCQIGRLLRGLALDATNHIVIELKLRPYKRVRLLFAVLAG